jgi:expansin (peptidoglycan-binding protein)
VTAHRLFAPRWLATGGVGVLALVIGAALLLQNGGSACAAALAAPPGTTAKSGKATFYDMAGGTGNCSLPTIPADGLFVALGPAEYSGAAACGTYLDVTGPKGKVRVKVIDSCPECAAGHIDLSRKAFKKIANEIDGIVPVKYKTVRNPATPGPISVRIKEGSSQYWFAAVIDNHANRLTSVKVASGGGSFKTAERADFNYWIIDGGAGSGPFKIKITDAYGKTATVSGIKLSPGATQKTSARLSGSSSSPESTPKPKSPAPTSSASSSPAPKKASPSATAPLLESTQVESPPAAAPAVEPEVALAAGAAGDSCG